MTTKNRKPSKKNSRTSRVSSKTIVLRKPRGKRTQAALFIAVFAVIGTILYLISSAATTAPGLLNGQTSAAGKWCMHDDNTSPAAPDPVDVARCNGLATQHWVFNGYTIKDMSLSGTRCLQPAAGSTKVDTTIVAAACNGGSLQEWRRDGSSKRLRSPAASTANTRVYPNGICLALPGNNVTYRLGLRPCSPNFPDQNWAVFATQAIYQNPMRGAQFSRGRVDQGVDYHGSGPIKFLGRAVIVQQVPPASAGWDGGWFIVYRLLDGDAAGKYVYVAEDCTPKHTVGKTIYGPNDTVCTMFNGSTGIEMGWAAKPPDHDFALAHAEYHEGLATSYGQNFSNLLRTLGSPDATGMLSKSSAISHASVSASWPKW